MSQFLQRKMIRSHWIKKRTIIRRYHLRLKILCKEKSKSYEITERDSLCLLNEEADKIVINESSIKRSELNRKIREYLLGINIRENLANQLHEFYNNYPNTVNFVSDISHSPNFKNKLLILKKNGTIIKSNPFYVKFIQYRLVILIT